MARIPNAPIQIQGQGDGFDGDISVYLLLLETVGSGVTNYSRIQYRLYVTKNVQTNARFASSGYKLYIGSEEVTGTTAVDLSSVEIGSEVTLLSGNVTITHNIIGGGSVAINAIVSTNATPLWRFTFSQTYELTPINRASSLTVAGSQIQIGASTSVTINSNSSEFTHNLSYTLEGSTGTNRTTGFSEYTNVKGGTLLKVPWSMVSNIPDGYSCTITLKCETLYNNVVIGSKTLTKTLIVGKFTITWPSGTSFTMATTTKYAITMKCDSAPPSNKIYYGISVSYNGQNAVTINKTAISSTSTSKEITLSPATFASKIPTKTSADLKFYVTLYSGDTTFQTATKTVTLKLPVSLQKPTINSVTLSDAAGYLEKYGKYITGKSKVKAVVSATASTGATLNYYYVDLRTQKSIEVGRTATYTFAAIPDSVPTGNMYVATYVRDTRFNALNADDFPSSDGKEVRLTKTISVIHYDPPAFNTRSVYRADSSGNADDTGTYIKIEGSVDYTAITSTGTAADNAPRVHYRFKGTHPDYTSWSDWAGITVASDGTFSTLLSNKSYDYSWQVELRVADNITTTWVTSSFSVAAAKFALDFYPSNELGGMGIGEKATSRYVKVAPHLIFRPVKTSGFNVNTNYSDIGYWNIATITRREGTGGPYGIMKFTVSGRGDTFDIYLTLDSSLTPYRLFTVGVIGSYKVYAKLSGSEVNLYLYKPIADLVSVEMHGSAGVYYNYDISIKDTFLTSLPADCTESAYITYSVTGLTFAADYINGRLGVNYGGVSIIPYVGGDYLNGYIRFPNTKIQIAWQWVKVTDTITTAWGSVYGNTNMITFSNWAAAFSTDFEPAVTYNVRENNSGNYVWVTSGGKSTYQKPGGVKIISGAKVNTSKTYWVSVVGIGEYG